MPYIRHFYSFYLYSNSILCTFKSMQHIHYMVIYTIISCIILYPKSFMYIMYSFWSHCEYILSTSVHHQAPRSLAISGLFTLILPTSCKRPNIKRSFKERISTLLFTSMLISTYIAPQGLFQSTTRSVHS